jgi:hypothetical protein
MSKCCCDIKNPFVRLLIYGFGGAIAGMLGGFVLGLGIWGLQLFVCYLGQFSIGDEWVTMTTFFGSGLGAVLGAVLGGVLALRKK